MRSHVGDMARALSAARHSPRVSGGVVSDMDLLKYCEDHFTSEDEDILTDAPQDEAAESIHRFETVAEQLTHEFAHSDAITDAESMVLANLRDNSRVDNSRRVGSYDRVDPRRD